MNYAYVTTFLPPLGSSGNYFKGSFAHHASEAEEIVLRKAYGKTADDSKVGFCNSATVESEAAVQAHARITRLSDERIKKKEIELTYEALRGLMIKGNFEEMCPLEFVATAKCQEINPSE